MRRFVRGRLWARILSSIVLGTIYVACPERGHAHICRPRLGCPPVESPRLSRLLAIQAVESDLSQNAPVVRFQLQKSLGAHPPADYTDLARAGLLRVVSGKPGQGSGPVYGLPENWQHDILSGFLRFSQVQTGDVMDYYVEIPVGQFRYVPGSAVLTLPDVRTASRPTVTFEYEFIGNANAVRLLRLGPAKDWTVSDYARAQTDLRKIGTVRKGTLYFRPCHAGWLAGFAGQPLPCP